MGDDTSAFKINEKIPSYSESAERNVHSLKVCMVRELICKIEESTIESGEGGDNSLK